MQVVSLTVPDEHPLVQFGFRGPFRLQSGLEFEIAGVSGRPRIKRRMASRKRKALGLMAEGLGPAEFGRSLGMCFERAEALYEELRRNLGLDRIERMLRSAIEAGLIASNAGPTARAPESPSTRRSACTDQGDAMNDEELVRIFFPDALSRRRDDGLWQVVIDPDARSHRLGEGMTEPEAWNRAVARLWKDEWFRPIIVQLRMMWSEQPGRT